MTTRPVVIGLKDKQPTALAFAAEIAAARHAALRVVHCLDIRSAGDFVSMPHDSWHAAGEAILEDARRFIEGTTPPPTTEYHLDPGLPYYTLREESETATLLVVGVDAVGGLDGLFGGTVTERLVTHSRVPIAVVPEHPWPHDGPGNVVVAVDAHASAAGPIRFAFTEARRRNLALQAIHVVTRSSSRHPTTSQAGLADAMARWSEEFPDVSVAHRLVVEDDERGLLRAPEETDVLVVGRSPEPAVSGWVEHPVLTEISSRARCPTVIVPNDWEDG